MDQTDILPRIIKIDQGRLYNYALAKLALSLMIPDGMLNIRDLEKLSNETKSAVQQTTSKCQTYVLAKKYLAIDELEEDNNKDIYYDKNYDKTFYDIKNEYDLNNINLEEGEDIEEAKINFLAEKLVETNGVNKNMAIRDAKAMLLGKRKVEDGDYAIVEIISSDGQNNLYYRRNNNRWERDPEISQDMFVNTNKAFCRNHWC